MLSTAEQTMKEAEGLLSLAQTNPKQLRSLAACATILLAVALEQSMKTIISFQAECVAIEEDVPIEETAYYQLLKEPLREKLQTLPDLLTAGEFRLNYGSGIITQLERLITKRNKLVHIDEQPTHLVTPDSALTVHEERIEARYSIPFNAWLRVSQLEAETYHHAVRCFLNEVLFPKDGKYQEGEILLRQTARQ
jgi:hypothetical protein